MLQGWDFVEEAERKSECFGHIMIDWCATPPIPSNSAQPDRLSASYNDEETTFLNSRPTATQSRENH